MVDSKLSGTVYNDKEGQSKAMAKLAAALVTDQGMDEIRFEKERYIYLPYEIVTSENVSEFQKK